ncbi:MAG TPA: zinc ribbon domain-containing protein [Terracidiphilus sp.]|nr:zinc ribbon domain-containing protein [Terracidiphilus sp.]
MASFCGTCGAPLADQATFCGGCGARKTTTGQDAQYQPVQQHVPPQPGATSVPSTAAAPAKSNALLKVGIAAVAVVAVGGVAAVAGVMYVGHKVIEKVHAVTGQASGEKTPADGGLASLLKSGGGSDTDATIKGDPCRFLSTEDVSHAVGITIVRAQAQDEGCSYIAHADPADMTSKHMASMLSNQAKSNGQEIDAKQQQIMQQIAGAFFKQQEASDKKLSVEAAKGEVIVLEVSFESKAARMAMKLSKAAFDHVKQGVPGASGPDSAGQTGTGDLRGLGDEAYEVGGTMLMVRKGDTLAQFLFNECPCGVDAIKPLAEKVISQL